MYICSYVHIQISARLQSENAFLLHANYFHLLQELKSVSAISNITTFYHWSGLNRNLMFNGSIYYVLIFTHTVFLLCTADLYNLSLKVPGLISQNGDIYSKDTPSPKKSWFQISVKSVKPFGYKKRLNVFCNCL